MKINKTYIESILQFLLRNKALLYGVILMTILLKILLFPVRLGDYNFYLEPWINFIKTHNYFYALKYDFYNYTPPYMYILVFLAKLGFNPLYSIKIVSVFFEYLLAFYVGKIIFLKFADKRYILLSVAMLPLVPTVLLNGAFWGQCDSIYSAFVVISLYYVINKRMLLSLFFLGVAFAFKAQTAFIFPLFFLLFIKKDIRWYQFLVIPFVYFIAIIPTWIQGRDLIDLFTIYSKQSDYFRTLTLFLPNVYVWVSDDFYVVGKTVGIITTIAVVIIGGYWLKSKQFTFDVDIFVTIAFLSVIITPFLLPGMHERYLYLGDIFSVLYIILRRKKIYIPIGVISVSFYAYMCCSRLKEILPLWPAFFVYLMVIILLLIDLKEMIKEKKEIYHGNIK